MSGTYARRSVVASVALAALLSAVPVHPWGDHGGITALAIDPWTPTTIYAGTSDRGLFKSTDGGVSWNATSLTNPVHGIVIDPLVPDTVYASTAIGVLKSTDGGTTWSATGLASGSVRNLVIDPVTPTTLYALIPDAGVFKTTDGGETWNESLSRIGPDSVTIAAGAPSAELEASTSPATRGAAERIRFCTPGHACDDGNPCTFGDICGRGRRCRGTNYSCNDGNVCTTDICDGAGGCNFPVTSSPCDDGNACTHTDTCSGGTCSGSAYICDDDNVCTDNVCNGLGGCRFPNTTALCNDGNACTGGDVCSGGTCTGTAPAEACGNGIDDDCDGLLDEGCPTACDGGCAAAETCGNFVDDDCDGYVDDGCPGCSTLENCTNGVDDDCDGHDDANDLNCLNCEAFECISGTICDWYSSLCVTSCNDGYRSSDEGDADCGGGCQRKCCPGQHCWSGWDCLQGSCVNYVCQ